MVGHAAEGEGRHEGCGAQGGAPMMLDENGNDAARFEIRPSNRIPMERGLSRLPHPIPYQGSKRILAPSILAVIGGRTIKRFYDPFAGSAALTIAASHARVASAFVLSDSLAPLVEVWRNILRKPT